MAPGLLAVLRRPPIAAYLAAAFMSGIGSWVFSVVAIVVIYRLTGSALLVGVVTSTQFVSTVLFVSWAGQAADRWDRRRLLVVLQSTAAVIGGVLAALAAIDRISPAVLIVASLALGVLMAFSAPALHALIPQIARHDELDVVVAANSLAFNLARAVGPMLAAGLVALGSVALAFSFKAVACVAFVALLGSLRPQQAVRRPVGKMALRSTVRESWTDENVRWPIFAVAAVAVTVDPVTTLAPVFVTQVFGAEDSATGYVLASFGVGAVLAAFVVVPRLPRGPTALAVTLAVTGAGVLGLALSPHLFIAVICLGIAGGGFLCSTSRATGALHQAVPAHRLGRTMSLWSVAFFGTRPPAALLDGALADQLGPRPAALVFSLPAMVVGALLFRRRGDHQKSSAKEVADDTLPQTRRESQ